MAARDTARASSVKTCTYARHRPRCHHPSLPAVAAGRLAVTRFRSFTNGARVPGRCPAQAIARTKYRGMKNFWLSRKSVRPMYTCAVRERRTCAHLCMCSRAMRCETSDVPGGRALTPTALWSCPTRRNRIRTHIDKDLEQAPQRLEQRLDALKGVVRQAGHHVGAHRLRAHTPSKVVRSAAKTVLWTCCGQVASGTHHAAEDHGADAREVHCLGAKVRDVRNHNHLRGASGGVNVEDAGQGRRSMRLGFVARRC